MKTQILNDEVMASICGGVTATQRVAGITLDVPADTGFYNVLFGGADLYLKGGIAAIDGGIDLSAYGPGVGSQGINQALS